MIFQKNRTPSRRLPRRAVMAAMLSGAAMLAVPGLTPVAAARAEAAQQIADHFSSVKTMAGEFVQFGPQGEQTEGKFYIDRPGKIRFDYESDFKVVADGKSIVIHNPRLDTAELYSLSQTPLKLLLDQRIDLTGDKVESVEEESDLTTIKLADKSVFGDSTITMMFDPESYELRQWTVTDAQGKDTTVMIFNVQQGVSLDPGMFEIDYRGVADKAGPSTDR